MNNNQTSQVELALVTLMTLAGCAAQVVPVGPDTYAVSSSGAGFSNAGQRAKVYHTANEFCAKRGLVMVPVSLDAKRGALFTRPPSADLVFRALKPGDPEIKRPNAQQVQVQEH